MESISSSVSTAHRAWSPTARSQQPSPARGVEISRAPVPRGRRRTITLRALFQRLSLLAAIELPCTVYSCIFGSGRVNAGRIEHCTLSDGILKLGCAGCCLQLQASTIDSVHLQTHYSSVPSRTSIEILSDWGAVIARIEGPGDAPNAAVWQDIMDTFDWV